MKVTWKLTGLGCDTMYLQIIINLVLLILNFSLDVILGLWVVNINLYQKEQTAFIDKVHAVQRQTVHVAHVLSLITRVHVSVSLDYWELDYWYFGTDEYKQCEVPTWLKIWYEALWLLLNISFIKRYYCTRFLLSWCWSATASTLQVSFLRHVREN